MKNPSIRTVFTRPDYLIAFGFGSGLTPKAPGTAGSVLGLLLFLPALQLPLLAQVGLIVAGFALGVYVSHRVAEDLKLKDPGSIVWDEFIGMWITMLWLPSWYWVIPAFLLFRFFDIVKPWPVSMADERVPGGLGIMLDDVVAGLYALGALQLIHLGVQYLLLMD